MAIAYAISMAITDNPVSQSDAHPRTIDMVDDSDTS